MRSDFSTLYMKRESLPDSEQKEPEELNLSGAIKSPHLLGLVLIKIGLLRH